MQRYSARSAQPLGFGVVAVCLLTYAATAFSFGTTECAATRFGANLVCTANDVSITGIAVAGGSLSACTGGSSVTLDLDLTVNSATPSRYDIGVFVSNDGNDGQVLPANGGAASCAVGILPPNDPPFRNLDPGPHSGVTDLCGDVNGSMNGGTGTGVLRMDSVTVACRAVSGSAGKLYIPFVVSWDQSSSPSGDICRSNADPVPGTKSKCNAPVVSQGMVDVVVMPTIAKTDGVTTINAGATTSYTVAIGNTTGDVLSSAVFTDPAVANLTVNSVTCVATGGATCPTTTVADMQGAGITVTSMPANSTVTFTINATVAGSASGSLTNTASVTVQGQTVSASDTNTVVTVDNFNAFESSTAANAISGSIHTKIAGVAFGLDVVAINSGTQSSGFSNNVIVELLANTGTVGSGYGADNCPTSSLVLQTIASTAISGGRSTVSFSAIANVYRDVRVRISYPTVSPTVIACSTDSFAIRPASLSFVAQDADRTSAGTTNTLNNVAISGGTVHNAGRPFQITATAYNGASTPVVTTNYDGTPTVVSSPTQCGGTACPPSFGTPTLGAWSASNGTVITTTASYSDVGAFSLRLEDSTFAAVDNSDGSTLPQRTVPSTATDVGRFVPDYIDVTRTFGCAAGSFTYSGQPFSVTATAYNASGGQTLNYHSAYNLAKDVTISIAGDPANFNNTNTILGASAFTNGSGSRTDVTYTFPAKETEPLVPTTLPTPPSTPLRGVDEDGVSSLNHIEEQVHIRSGRVQIQNAFGSELLDLAVPMRAQYYTANGWVTNAQDTCTGIAAANLTLNGSAGPGPVAVGGGTTTASVASNPMAAGDAGLSLSAPAPPNDGYVDVTVDLSPAGLNMPWLQFNWDGTGGEDNPQGRATFGIYRGSPRHIHIRERF